MGITGKIKAKLRGIVSPEELQARGLVVGKRFKCLQGVIIDDSHCWLIEIGDDVTMAPRVHILAHDASTKTHLGYTKIGRVTIGNNVFIGAESVVLPGVTIGDNSIVGANSTVTHDVPANSVVAGSPAKVICSLEDYLAKERKRMESSPCYDESWTLRGAITAQKKERQKADLANGIVGYVD